MSSALGNTSQLVLLPDQVVTEGEERLLLFEGQTAGTVGAIHQKTNAEVQLREPQFTRLTLI